jgi:general control protein GCN4
VHSAATMASDFDLFDVSGSLGASTLGLESHMDLFGGSNFTSINDASVASDSTRTVSPKDLFNDGGLSAPPSTAFTNLTSPDINSPLGLDSYDTSPMFGADDLNSGGGDWFPLFGDATDAINTSFSAQSLERTVSTASNAQSSASSTTNSPVILDVNNRRKASVASPPMSAYNGVKSRRRKQPLPPISVDPGDKIALKRARNTLAARESRQRKLDHVSVLEARVEELEAEKAAIAAEVAKWKAIAIASDPTLSQS